MSSQESKSLFDAQRAREWIRTYPAISAQELADTLGLNSVVYAQTLMVSVNAHKREEEGVD